MTMTVHHYCEWADIKKTKAYGLIKDGRLQTIKIGRRTLITVESAEALMAQSLVKQGNV